MSRFSQDSWGDIVDDSLPSESLPMRKRAVSEFVNLSSNLPKFWVPAVQIPPRSLSDANIFTASSNINLPKTAKTCDDYVFRYLPDWMHDVIDAGIFPNFNTYVSAVSSDDVEGAKNILKALIAQTTDKTEINKILRSAFDVNKKFSKYTDAIEIFSQAAIFDPTNIAFPLEAAKLLNDLGNFEKEDEILMTALSQNDYNATVLTKMLKSLERRNLLKRARKVLGIAYAHNPQALFEGALFEIRHGPSDAFLYLIETCGKNADWKGNTYHEIVELCSRRGLRSAVLKFSEAGYKEVPSLFALCGFALKFQNNIADAFALYENSCESSQMSRPRLAPILATILMNHHEPQLAHKVMAQAIASAPADQKSRLFYNAAVLSFLFSEMKYVQMLLAKGRNFCHKKAQLPFHIFRAKIQELSGFPNATAEANRIFKEVVNNFPEDWHAHLEYILFLSRHNHVPDALRHLNHVLSSMPDNARLLALRIQLESPEKQVEAFINAIHNAPKSGEIWLEGARICLNPVSPYFNLKDARIFLDFAHAFTPKYLDIFVEYARLEMLENGLYGKNATLHGKYLSLQDKFLNSEGNQGATFFRFRVIGKELFREEFDTMIEGVRQDLQKNYKVYQHAIARSAFVPLSLKDELDRIQKDQATSPSFAFGISNFGQKGFPLDVLGTSSIFM